VTRFGDITDTISLANGVEMPRFGLGTYKTAPGDEAVQSVRAALDAGYRLIDTAALYGNEADVGRVIAESGVPREEAFVTTKVWNDDQGYEKTAAAIGESLRLLGMEYVDLYLVHWPRPDLMHGTWAAMEEALSAGKVRAIGVCNHLEHHIDALCAEGTVAPMVNQLEFHLRLQQPGVVEYCQSRGIVVEAWAPLMRGRVADIPDVIEIATKHGVTPIQVAIRWVLQRDVVAIPKSARPERILSNAGVFGFELSEADMETLDGLDTGERLGRHPDNFDEAGPVARARP
jgi:diketogulonate reductase-like aldo/keto reductase